MKIKRLHKKKKEFTLSRIFLYSALFFAFFTFFGVYKYTVYSWTWFVLFFVYELLFYLGLKSNKLRVGKAILKLRNSDTFNEPFELSKIGASVLLFFCVISVFCFAYFLYLYRSNVGAFAFGTYGAYTATSFEEGRTKLEKITLLLMHAGSETAFLVCAIDSSNKYKKIKLFTHFTLFLPGIRYLLMGSRFSIAVEFLLLFAVKWPILRAKINFSDRVKREKRLIILIAIVLGIVFMYLFSARSIYYTAFERKAFNVGDMQMKPFWKNLYSATGGKIDPICSLSDYLGESPYIFSYFCKNRMPEKIYWGQFMFRSILQIINNLFYIGKSFPELTEGIASGQYSGMVWILIVDFGAVGSFFFAYLLGKLFELIEKYRCINRTCGVIYPALKVMCFFAPVFYFYVGRLDYVLLFCLILSPICLKRKGELSASGFKIYEK